MTRPDELVDIYLLVPSDQKRRCVGVIHNPAQHLLQAPAPGWLRSGSSRRQYLLGTQHERRGGEA